MFSDGKCDNSTLTNSFDDDIESRVYHFSRRFFLDGSRKFETKSKSRSMLDFRLQYFGGYKIVEVTKKVEVGKLHLYH